MRLHGLHGYTAQLLCMRLHLVLYWILCVHTAQLLASWSSVPSPVSMTPRPLTMPHHQLTRSRISH